MNNKSKRLLTILLALFMILTSFPLNAFAAQTETNVRNEITDIRTVGDKQVINLGTVKGQSRSNLGFFSGASRFLGFTTQRAGSSSETVAQKVEINLETLGLNLEEDQFDPSALTEVGSFDVEITFKELGGTRTETRTMTFQAGETTKTETFYLPKDFGNGNVEAEIPKLKENIALRVYVGAGSTTNFNLGQDMTYKFELSQIIHPVIDLKVVDPYGKELQENIDQVLGLKLALEEEHDFNLPANTKTFNIRTLTDFAGDNVADLNSTGDNLKLSLTTALDKDNKLKVGNKTYKLNKITYNALGQEVEINGQKKKVGGYIEFATQPKIIVPTPDEQGDLPKTPDGYKRLSFHAETSVNANDGRFEDGEKLKVIDVLEGTEFKDKELLARIAKVKNPISYLNGRPDDKKFLKWNPALPTDQTAGEVKDTDYWAVYLADGDEIIPGEPLPKGVFEVKVIKDDTIAADPLYGKSYGVFNGSKLRRDKFPDLEAADGYKNPKWTTEADAPNTGMVEIKKPWTKEITKATTFKATAGADAATQIGQNGLKAVDTTALQGQELDEKFWHKGVALADNVDAAKKDAFAALLKDATVTDITKKEGQPALRNTNEAGTFPGTLLVTFKDGSTLEVPNQKLIVKPNTVEVSFDDKKVGDDVNAPRHNETVVKGKVTSTESYPVKGAKVEIKDKDGNVIGITQVIDDEGNFKAGTRELKAGEKLTASVTLPDSKLAAESKPKTVKLNADRLKELLPIAKAQKDNFSKKQNAIIKQKLENLGTAITDAEKLVDKNYKPTATDTAENQTAIDNAVKALEEALKALTANIPPSISGPKTHEIFVGQDLDLKKLVDITDGDGADDLVVENGSNVKISAVKVDGQTETPVTDLTTIKNTVGTYKVTYTAKDNSNAEVTHEMTLTVKPRTTSAIEVTKDPTNMSYLITEKNGKAKLNLDGMTLNLVDNLGKKTEVELNNPNLKLKVNGREVTNGAELNLKDDVQFIEVEYKDGDKTLTAKTDGVLRVGPDYDSDNKDDRTQDFDVTKIEKLEVIKQPKLDYIAKDKSEADKVFKLNLEGMIVRMTDKAGKEKLAVVKNGKFYDYDEPTKEIVEVVDKEQQTTKPVLTATPAHGAKLTPETAADAKGDNGKTVEIKSTNGKTANTDPLKVFYDANKDGNPDYESQKTPAPSAMARNVGENPQGTTVEGMATPGAVIKIYKADDTNLTNPLAEVKADETGHYTATVTPMLADGTKIKVTAKLGEMGESDPTETKVFDDKNNNKQPDRDEGFNIAKATNIKFVDQPDLTYLVKTKETEVTFNGKDGKGKPIYLELSYKNGDKTESKIMTLEELMKDTENIAVTPAKGTKDKIANQTHDLVGKNLEVKLVKVNPETATSKATSTSKFAIEIDADGNGTADKDEKTPAPTAKALNVGKDPKSTTITGKAEKGATVIAKVDGVEVGRATADNNGDYTIEAKKENKALPLETKVNVTAQVGVKQPSDPTEAIVKEDKDGNGTPDNEQGFDITKAAKIEMVSDPNKMDYLVTSQDGTVKFDATGMLVRVTDKAGKEKLYTAAELTDDTTNFTVAPAHDSDLTIKANDGNKVKVTLKTAPADMQTKEVETTGKLSVKLDANNNGIADEKEKFDIAKTTKVTIIQDPSKMNYLVTTKEGKTPFETAGVVIKLEDASGKTVTYNAEELKNLTEKIKLSPAEGEQLGLDNGKTKTSPFTVTITGAESQTKPTATGGNVKVQLDADDNGIADEDEESAMPENVKAMNQNVEEGDPKKVTDKEKTTTTVTGKVKPGATVKITSADGTKDLTPSKIDIDSEGNFTAEIDKQAVGTKIKVWATEPGKKISKPAPADVFRDADNNGEDDSKAGVTERPAAIASNVGSKPTFTTIKGKTEKGATITVTVKVGGEEKAVTVENLKVNDDGTYTLEAKYDNKPLENGAEILVYAENAPKKISKPQTTTVFNDVNKDGKPDGGKVDLTNVKDIQVIAPDKMSYTQGEKLVGTGLKAIVRDNGGNIEIFDYDNATGKFKDADGKEVTEITATVANKPIKDLALTEKDHNGKAIDVKVSTIPGSTNQKLEVKQLQTPTPTIEFAANQNTLRSDGTGASETPKKVTTVKFTVKNKPTTVYVKYTVNGEAKEETFDIGAKDDATKTVDLKVKLPIGADVEVLAKDADKLISDAASAKVVRDSNNDGKDDGKKALGEPVIEDIKAGSNSITVTPPEGATKLVISETDKDGKTPQDSTPITVTKGKDGNWKIGDTPVEKTEDGKLIIPNPEDDKKLKLDEYNVVKVDAEGDKDTTTPSKAVKTVGKAKDTEAPAKPKVDQPVDGDENIKVKTPTEPDAKKITVEVSRPAKPAGPGEEPGKPTVETIVVTKGEDGNWKTPNGEKVPEVNGKLEIPVETNKPLKTGDDVKVTTTDNDDNNSVPYTEKVVAKIKMDKPEINPIKTGDRTVEGTALTNKGKPDKFAASTVDIYKYQPPTEEGKEGTWTRIAKDVAVDQDTGAYKYNHDQGFKDGDKIRVVAKKPGAEDSFNEITAGVDTTALDKAIQDGKDALDKDKGGKNNGTPEDKALEDAIKKGEDLKKKDPAPTQDEVDKAQKDIEKAIEDKKAADEARDKLQEKINEANGKKNDPAYPTKPDDVKKELDDAAKDGQKVHDDSNKSKEDIEKEIEKIQEKIDQYNKQQIGVNIDKIVSTSKDIKVIVTAPNAKVEVFKVDFDYDTYEEVLTPIGKTTSITRVLIVTLNETLPKGTDLFIKVTHPDYLSYESTITVE